MSLNTVKALKHQTCHFVNSPSFQRCHLDSQSHKMYGGKDMRVIWPTDLSKSKSTYTDSCLTSSGRGELGISFSL